MYFHYKLSNLQAKKNMLAIEDMEGGTFSISNGGVFGSLFGTPIINQPQSAILGIHTIKKRPVVVNDQVGNEHLNQDLFSPDYSALI